MRLLSSFLALFLSINVVSVTAAHGGLGISVRHHLISPASLLEARAPAKRCSNRVNKHAKAIGKNNTNAANTVNKTTSSSTIRPKSTASAQRPPVSNASSGNGLIKNVPSACGGPRATRELTALSGRNGHIDYLNCGFEAGGGWNPPHLTISDIVYVPLSSALQNPNSPFKACASYVWMFEEIGNRVGVPPIMLASFAMQESSCKPDTVGGGGEQGLMQITHEKCVGAPNGNCREPYFNINTAANYFAQRVRDNNGNILLSAGNYNGFSRGLTRWQAFAAANSPCCRCQNNGDYLHQLLNAWMQNIDAYTHIPRVGRYFNLDVCG